MADNSAIIIIIIMLMSCCVSIIIAGGGFWTCTGGTFDTGDFDFEKCLTIPSDDDLTGPSPTGPTGPTVPKKYQNCWLIRFTA